MAVVLLQARGIWVNLRVGKGSTSTFAKVTHAPYDYIFLGEPIELEIKALIIMFSFSFKTFAFFSAYFLCFFIAKMGFHLDVHWDFHVASWHVSCLLAMLALLLGQGHKKYRSIFPKHFNFRQPEAARFSQSYETVEVFTGSRFQSAATSWSREQKHLIFSL